MTDRDGMYVHGKGRDVLSDGLGAGACACWTILTVTALHKRDVYFWSLGSTWTSVIACPVALVIMPSALCTTRKCPSRTGRS